MGWKPSSKQQLSVAPIIKIGVIIVSEMIFLETLSKWELNILNIQKTKMPQKIEKDNNSKVKKYAMQKYTVWIFKPRFQHENYLYISP